MKDIVIIANFASGLVGDDNNRFPYLAAMLAKINHVELVTSDFDHGSKKKRTSVAKYSFKITLLNEPGYKKNICLRRFWSHFVFGKNVFKYLKTRTKPDVVYCAMPSLTAAAAVSNYCKKNGIRFIIDVQDLWPEAFQMVLNIPAVDKILFAPFRCLANKAYRYADEIVAVSRTYMDRAKVVNKTGAKGIPVFLGTNLDTFDNNAKNNKVTKSDSSELWLAYCGTLGSSYDLTCVFDALKIVKNSGIENVKFFVMGDGPRKSEFELYAKKLQLNVVFTGCLPYAQMCGLLSSCDIAINPIMPRAAQSIINKHADYAAAGIPVINTQECLEYRNLVDKYKMGFNCKNNDALNLAQMIERLIMNPDLRIEMGNNARKCAEEKFNRKNTYAEIIGLF